MCTFNGFGEALRMNRIAVMAAPIAERSAVDIVLASPRFTSYKHAIRCDHPRATFGQGVNSHELSIT